MDAVRRLMGLVSLLAGEAAAIWALHRLGRAPWLAVGWEDPDAWLAAVAPEDAVMAALRLVALVAAYWLAATTVCYSLARAAHLPAAARSVGWATLPAVRRMADRAVAVVLAGSSVAVGAPGVGLADVVAPPAVSAPADLPGDPARPESGQPDPTAPEPTPPEVTPGPVTPPAAPPGLAPHGADAPAPGLGALPGEPGRPGTHTVAPGDNLWAITAAALDGSATDAEIIGPWRALIDANRDRLRSGDPDLIYPGERLVLPGSADTAPTS